MRYTYDNHMLAHNGRRTVVVPDQVAGDQRAYDGRTFPALADNGARVRVRLRGDLYGLHTAGTGDMVVTRV